MKNSKITGAMQHIDDDMISAAATAGGKKRRLQMTTPKMTWKSWVAAAAAFSILVLATVFIVQFIATPTTVVAFDVNPSLEIEIDGKGRVDEVRALNEDAKVVLADLDLEKTPLKTAVYAIIGSMLTHDYITADKNSILISIDCNSEKKVTELQSGIVATVTELLKSSNIEASVITQSFGGDKTVNTEAETYKISEAKATLIHRIIASGLADGSGTPYTYEQLVALTVHELKMMLDSKPVAVGGIHASGSASHTGYIGRTGAITAALTHAGLEETDVLDVEVEVDFNILKGMMYYEVEIETAEWEYEYKIDAITGEVLKVEKEVPDHDDDRDEDFQGTPTGCKITKEDAIMSAITHAGLPETAVYDIECELDKKFGVMYYEVEFEAEGYEYEYTIDVETGEVLTHSKTRD